MLKAEQAESFKSFVPR